jgi:hypothetical protein
VCSAHACHLNSYRKLKIRRMVVLASLSKKQDPVFKITRPKRAGGVAQVVERLPCKSDALSSNTSTTKGIHIVYCVIITDCASMPFIDRAMLGSCSWYSCFLPPQPSLHIQPPGCSKTFQSLSTPTNWLRRSSAQVSVFFKALQVIWTWCSILYSLRQPGK